jgi:hypothetical protein
MPLGRHDLADAVHGENVLSHLTCGVRGKGKNRHYQRLPVACPRPCDNPVCCGVSVARDAGTLPGTKPCAAVPLLYPICL